MATASVLVVTHNSAAYLERCLRAISAQDNREVLVVDNASTDDGVTIARAAGNSIRVIANPQNLGFAAAVNQAVRLSQSPIFVILNPDTIAMPGALDELLRCFADTSVGAAGGALCDPNDRPQKGFQVRRFPSLLAMLSEVLVLNRIWRQNPWNRSYRCHDLDDSRPQFVDQPAGACLAVRREAWDSIGGFDESFYPVWFEDVDFCRRLANRGWKIAYWPDARFTHAGGHSVSKLPFRDKQAFWYGNMLRYFSKHHGRLKTAVLRAGILAGLALRSLASLMGAGPRDVPVKEALAGYAHAARIVVQRNASHAPSKHSVGVAAV